jgi:drug/metabolite transporter (DMT)-like permease
VTFVLTIMASVAGGSVPPFAKIAGTAFQPFTLVLIRFFLATTTLLPFVYKRRELSLNLFRDLVPVSLIGSLNPILLFIALPFTTASVAPLIYAAVPLMTVIYTALWTNIKIQKGNLLGLIVGFIGIAIVVLLPLFQNRNIDVVGFTGNGLIFLAALAFMVYGVISKQKQDLQASPLALTFYFCLTTFLISIPFSLYEVLHRPIALENVNLAQLAAAMEVGIIGTSVLYISYQQALKTSSALVASLFTYFQPVATILFAILLLREKLSLPFVGGGVLAIVGARLASRKSVE